MAALGQLDLCATLCDIEPASPASNKTRHVSLRVPDALYQRLEVIASEQDETVSQVARRLLERGSTPPAGPLAAVDDAITALQHVRRGITDDAARRAPIAGRPTDELSPDGDRTVRAREVNVQNARSNFSRLLADVGRGEEIVIVHAGVARARLAPVGDDEST